MKPTIPPKENPTKSSDIKTKKNNYSEEKKDIPKIKSLDKILKENPFFSRDNCLPIFLN